MKRILSAMAIMTACIGRAEDIKTISGTEYKDVTISRVEPDGLVLMTDAGIEKVAFDQLTKEAQEKYGYDADKAARFAAATNAAQLALQQKAKADKDAAKKRLEESTNGATSPVAGPATPISGNASTAAETQKPIVKALDKEGGMKKFASLTVDEVAASPFSLEGVMVRLAGIRKIEPQEVSAGEYEVSIWGMDAGRLIARVSSDKAAIIGQSKDLYVSVLEPKRYGTVITIHGNAARQEGLSVIPVVRWE